MRYSHLLLFLLFVGFSIVSCKKDPLTTDPNVITTEPENTIEASFNGFITDSFGEPLEDAVVSISNMSTVSNEFGFFELTNTVDTRFALIKVEKSGYFNQYETLIPSDSKTAVNRTKIRLRERIETGRFASGSAGVIIIENDSEVAFASNSFVDELSNPYNGEVRVYSHYIDPTHIDIDQIMPGNLMAVNAQSELNILQSFGMLNIELEGDDGQRLQINKPATIKVQVPSELDNKAPSEIPLWYFDEDTGLWVEDGSATLESGLYVGEVNHFTTWNADVPTLLTLIEGEVIDAGGVPQVMIRITDLSTGASFSSYTNSDGTFSGFVPRDAELLFEILGFCGPEDVLFSTSIGPFTEDMVDLGSFEISNNTNFTTISGVLVDCEQQPISNGRVYFTLPSQSYTQQTTTTDSGTFSAILPSCDMADIEIVGVDLNTDLVSQTVMVTADENNPIDLGSVEVCADISADLGSVTLFVDGEEKIFDNCTVTISTLTDTTSYLFTYYETLPPVGDTLVYYWLLYEGNNDLSNPNWLNSSLFFSKPLSAEDELYFRYSPSYQQGMTNIVVDEEAVFKGDLMKLDISNITISRRINDPDGPNILTSFPGSSMTIDAVLQ